DWIVDTQKHAPCISYLWDYPGDYRDVCVADPSVLLTESFHLYMNTSCTSDASLVSFSPAPADCHEPPPKIVVDFVFTDGQCGLHYDVRALGPSTTTTEPLFTGTPESCTPLLPLPQGEELHSIGAVLPPTSFPKLELSYVGLGPLRVA